MSRLLKRVAPHLQRVAYDGGVAPNNIQDLLLLQRSNEELKDYIKVAFCPELYGSKIRTSGINNFITKGYSKDSGANNDITQTSSTNQPFLDKIAPAEKLSAKNPNVDDCYLTHPTVSFGANDEWTVETVLNWNGRNNSADAQICGGGYRTRIGIDLGSYNNIIISSDDDTAVQFTTTKKIASKTIVFNVTYDSVNLRCYINGELVNTTARNKTFIFSRLLAGYNDVQFSYSKVFSHHIFSKALSPNQIAERDSILRSIFPEIPFTRIGEQIWSVRNFEAVVTPQGNLIAEIQAVANVEKIVNGSFTTDTNWSKQNATIANGVLTIVGASSVDSYAYQRVLTPNKWSKITYEIKANRTGVSIAMGSIGAAVLVDSTVGVHTFYKLLGSDTGFVISKNSINDNVDIDIDNVSVQEIGWSGSQELYDGIYAQTAGTVEQKTYAAVKAAAMWCHYNNDTTLGATYGKLYNWFAVKLLQMDIDNYNTNNPATPWGWRVPTQADFQTLSTYLGGDAVSGGKLKMTGTTYWNSPNTGADNSSGFSALGCGFRNETGLFTQLVNHTAIITITESGLNCISYRKLASSNSISEYTDAKIRGYSLRLIKS